MTLEFKVVIPARLGSTRLPGKVLRLLAGKPMVQWTWQAALASGAEQVIVATDSDEVLRVCRDFGADARLTATTHESGTDRVDEIARVAAWDPAQLIVNLQGDEPLMPPAMIRHAAELLAHDPSSDIATLCHPLAHHAEWTNPNMVKVVMDARGHALYFSRAPIPFKRAAGGVSAMPEGLAYRHIGLYAYRAGTLRRFSALPPSSLEQSEMLEQLRALTHGLRIRVGISALPPPRGVDTAEDLAAVDALLVLSLP